MKALRWLISYIIIQFSLLFLFTFILMRCHYSPEQIVTMIGDYQWLFGLLLGIIFIPILSKQYKSFNKKEKSISISKWFVILLFGVCLSILYNTLIYYLNSTFHFTNLYNEGSHIFSLLLCTVLIGPIIEELLFRGIMYHDFKQKYSNMKSILLTTFIFSLLHFTGVQMLYAFALGFILLYIYLKYQTIKAPILLHMASNATTIGMVYVLQCQNFVLNYCLFLTALGIVIALAFKQKRSKI